MESEGATSATMSSSKPSKTQRRPGSTQQQANQDDLVMSTNNSSIASKRSVERLYYPDEPHYFRFFVNKLQRRAPLINRGYHLRLHAIDVTVRNFLQSPSPRRKVVVNLGCGSDVLPWQCWVRYPDDCKDVVFVDIDFPDLIARKRAVVLRTSELVSPLGDVETPEGSPVFLRSSRYMQIGCDLRHHDVLGKALQELVGSSNVEYLFVAEVSITYMETPAADALIQWAASISDYANFCLMEQILPDGPSHPFAQTMLRHFNKLNTPIKSVNQYPTLASQRTRFLERGWLTVRPQSLLQMWEDDSFISKDTRLALNQVEAFDEWEDFALFASHYCLLTADNFTQSHEAHHACDGPAPAEQLRALEVSVTYRANPPNRGHRKFGAAFTLKDALGVSSYYNLMGMGPRDRLGSYDTYRREGHDTSAANPGVRGPGVRMCHTLVDLGDAGVLLAGGRTSPTKTLSGCWMLCKRINAWTQVSSLPVQLYRHAAARLGVSSLCLVAGGKTSSGDVSGLYLIFHPDLGWVSCAVGGEAVPEPVFGASLACTNSSESTTHFAGILGGGLRSDGTMSQDMWRWDLDLANLEEPVISFQRCKVQGDHVDGTTPMASLLNRFGAQTAPVADNYFLICGGVTGTQLLKQTHDIILCQLDEQTCNVLGCLDHASTAEKAGFPPPLLVGSSLAMHGENSLVVMGGGATCFSMGSFWNSGVYVMQLAPEAISGLGSSNVNLHGPAQALEYWQTPEVIEETAGIAKGAADAGSSTQPVPIQQIELRSAQDFESLLQAGKPAVIRGLNIGSCVEKWNADYLRSQVPSTQEVVVHESTTASMDFNAKNFRYTTKPFHVFVNDIQAGAKSYLRALSNERPADSPADLTQDFSALADDFVLPPELAFVTENFFSSVLRVSGPVNMWLHYDVMANIYSQIHGSKRFLLFPPSDISHIPIAPGSSSSSLDVFATPPNGSLPANTHPHEATLGPGDVLFLPPLWLHAARPVSSPISIAVNVFFRSLREPGAYAAGRDVYGNRDLAAYEKGRADVARIAQALRKLPPDARAFYGARLAEELVLLVKADGEELH